jgi:hypothetical protein
LREKEKRGMNIKENKQSKEETNKDGRKTNRNKSKNEDLLRS